MTLLALLKQYRREKSDPYNIIGMGDFNGRYFVDADSEELFWNTYDWDVKNHRYPSIAETPLNLSVVRLDVDISIVTQAMTDNGIDRQNDAYLCYTFEQVMALIKICNQELKNCLVDISDEYLRCLLLEKNARIEYIDGDGKNNLRVKRGFHLHWPLVVTNNGQQRDWIFNVIKTTTEKNIFDQMETCPIDLLSSSVNWLMYGSKKPNEEGTRGKFNHEPYWITHGFDVDGNTIPIESITCDIKLRDSQDSSLFLENVSLNRKMTIRPCGRKSFQFKSTISTWTSPQLKTFDQIQGDIPNMEHVERLLEMLDHKRCVDYGLWLSVGRCLFTITNGASEGLELWNNWSMNCIEKFTNGVCQYKWSSFSVDSFGIGLLKNWAKTDNSEMYKAWTTEVMAKTITGGASETCGEIAKIASRILGDNLKYSDGDWFEFCGHIWKQYPQGPDSSLPLLKLLSENVHDKVGEVARSLHQDNGKEPDPEVKRLVRIKCKLEEPSVLKGIVQMMQLLYNDHHFKDNLNKNVFVIAMKNGVYDLKECVFRDGRPEDNISQTINCNYREFKDGSSQIVELEKHLESFFPSPDIRKYMLDVLSNIFVGNLYMKHLFFWVGTGDNGKSAFSRMFEELLGPGYCVKLPTTLLTGVKADAGRASPELVQLLGKRLALFDEPDQSESISNGLLKQLTGRDSICPRDLFQKGRDIKPFVPLCIYVFICNKEPDIKNSNDSALWSRFRVCPFESTFVAPEDAPATREEQVRRKIFPKDVNFVNDVSKLKEALAFYLLEHWKKTKDHEIETPMSVKKASENYRANNNLLARFFKETMEQDENGVTDLKEFMSRFSDFCAHQQFRVNIMSKLKVIEELRKMAVDVGKSDIIGWTMND